jgi:aromatic ring-cleaving dioxygenase
MTEKTTQSVANLGYHAHIYYDLEKTRAVAERVCAALGGLADVGRDLIRTRTAEGRAAPRTKESTWAAPPP